MRNYNNYADMITFSRASSGTALAKISYGSEMVTNGTFDDATGWTLGTGMAVANGVLNFINAAFAATSSLPIGYVANTVVKISVDVSISSGRIEIWLGGTALGSYVAISNITTSGTYEAVVNTAGTDGNIYVRSLLAGTNGNVDNLSVKPVLYDQPDGTLQLYNHPTNQPRVEYDAQGNRLGLLVEEARTNYNPNSDNFSVWTKTNTTESNGLVTATAVNNTHRISRAFSGFSGAVVSWADMKFGTHRYVQIYDGANTTNFATFDLVEGTVTNTGSNTTGFISQIGDGIYRCAAAYGTVNPANGNSFIGFANGSYSSWGDTSFDADGTETFYIYRHQIEAGTFPTSYIPTSGATATRSADVASIGVGAFGYNKTAGTTVVQAVSFAPSNFRYFYSFHDNSGGYNNSSLLFLQTTSALPTYQRLSAGAYEVNTTQSTAYTPGQITKFAVAEAIDDMSFVQDANDPKVDTAGVFPLGIETMNIGSSPVNNLILNGHISSIAYYPRRLTDAQIQKLTQVKAVPTLSLTFDGNSDSYLETSIHG